MTGCDTNTHGLNSLLTARSICGPNQTEVPGGDVSYLKMIENDGCSLGVGGGINVAAMTAMVAMFRPIIRTFLGIPAPTRSQSPECNVFSS